MKHKGEGVAAAWIAATAAGILPAACGGGASSLPGGEDTREGVQPTLEVVQPRFPPDPGWETTSDLPEVPEAGGDPGHAGLPPCETGSDCPTGLCVEGPDGARVCAPDCLDTPCPEGWSCQQVANVRGDAVFLCLPEVRYLCRPCTASDGCRPEGVVTTDYCNLFGPEVGAFCGRGCSGDESCPDGFSCRDATSVEGGIHPQCLPDAGECECLQEFIEGGYETVCVVANEHGSCRGTRRCVEGGLSPCDAATPAPEECNGVDDDCDGSTDEGLVLGPCEISNDHGTCEGVLACVGGQVQCQGTAPAPETCNGTDDDCDGQTDPDGTTGCTPYFLDADGDGFGVAAESRCLCAPEAPYSATVVGDCDDQDPSAHSGGVETCGGGDEDCDGMIDEEGAAGCQQYFADADEDGAGDPAQSACLCSPDANHLVTDHQDCDDHNPLANPSAHEACNGFDDDCDGLTDEDGAQGCILYYKNADGDPYGDSSDSRCLCGPNAPYDAASGGDCNDQDPGIGPGATEKCNDLDDDCDGTTDEEGAQGCKDWFADADGDHAGSATDKKCLCGPSGAYQFPSGTDCDDSDPSVHPGAGESCNGKDDNCDGATDEEGAAGCKVYYYDGDNDGWGVSWDWKCLCGPAKPYLTTKVTDCLDSDPTVNPGHSEECNNKDDNCDGVTDAFSTSCSSLCGTGIKTCVGGEWGACTAPTPIPCKNYQTCQMESMCVSSCPAAPPESCNGKDDDCNGQIDETFTCVPGQQQSQSCGNCGTQSRTCTSSCQWGTWGACQGQGVCTPGQQQSQSCGNCGTQSRTCTSSCQWGTWGACQGQGVCTPGQTTQGGCDVCAQKVCQNNCQWSGCQLLPGKTCEWKNGTNWECCAYHKWHFCLPPSYGEAGCKWSPDCVWVSNACY